MDVCWMFGEHDFWTKQITCFLCREIQLASLGTTAEIKEEQRFLALIPYDNHGRFSWTLKKSKSTVFQGRILFLEQFSPPNSHVPLKQDAWVWPAQTRKIQKKTTVLNGGGEVSGLWVALIQLISPFGTFPHLELSLPGYCCCRGCYVGSLASSLFPSWVSLFSLSNEENLQVPSEAGGALC